MVIQTGGTSKNLLIWQPTGADVSNVTVSIVGEEGIAEIAEVGSITDNNKEYTLSGVSEGVVTLTATDGTHTTTSSVAVFDDISISSISFPEDMPSTIGPTGPTGEIEGTFVIEPEYADLSNLTITSSEPTMVEADLRAADKSQFIVSTTPSAVNNTEVTITVTDGTVSATHTLTIVIP